jgi:hypothetical protein
MLHVSKSSWHMKVPEYLSYFYAFNQFMFALGVVDAMLGPLLGMSDEMVHVFTGPVGDFGSMGVGISALCLGLIFRIDESTAPDQVKKIFQVFLIDGLFWGLIGLPFAFVNGIMGVPGMAQFGTIVWVLHIGVSALVLSKL